MHMTDTAMPGKPRVLVIDDNRAIHEDLRKIFGGADQTSALLAAERALLGETSASAAQPSFDIEAALQGQEGAARAQHALEPERPFPLALAGMRMPPGWDGLETVERLWPIDP